MPDIILPFECKRVGSESLGQDVWVYRIPIKASVSRDGVRFKQLSFWLDISHELSTIPQPAALKQGLITSTEITKSKPDDLFHNLFVRFEAIPEWKFVVPFRFRAVFNGPMSFLTLGGINLSKNFDWFIQNGHFPMGKALCLRLKEGHGGTEIARR